MSRIAVLFAVLLLSAGISPAQISVYRMAFEPTGESINYRSYQAGYYVAPMEGGQGSLILMLTSGGVKQYFTYNDFGEMFIALSNNTRKAVFSATAANTVSTTCFYAIGDASKEINVETRAARSLVFVATRLNGYAVSADSERDLPFSSAGSSDVGVAGAAELRMVFEEGMSAAANRENRDVAAEIANIRAFLEGQGYTDGLAPPPGQGGGGGGGGAGGGGGGAGGGGFPGVPGVPGAP
jgi:hypothetical protein